MVFFVQSRNLIIIFGFILTIHVLYNSLLSNFGSAHYIIRYRDIVPNARERIMIFSFRYYSFLPKFEFLKFCLKNGGSVKEILMIPTPIVFSLFSSAHLFAFRLVSQILFQISRPFFVERVLRPGFCGP